MDHLFLRCKWSAANAPWNKVDIFKLAKPTVVLNALAGVDCVSVDSRQNGRGQHTLFSCTIGGEST